MALGYMGFSGEGTDLGYPVRAEEPISVGKISKAVKGWLIGHRRTDKTKGRAHCCSGSKKHWACHGNGSFLKIRTPWRAEPVRFSFRLCLCFDANQVFGTAALYIRIVFITYVEFVDAREAIRTGTTTQQKNL
jgi:hypothetical protein